MAANAGLIVNDAGHGPPEEGDRGHSACEVCGSSCAGGATKREPTEVGGEGHKEAQVGVLLRASGRDDAGWDAEDTPQAAEDCLISTLGGLSSDGRRASCPYFKRSRCM